MQITELTLTEYTFRILNPQKSNEIKINYRNQKRSHLYRVAAFIHQIYRVPSIKILRHTSVRRRRKTVRQQLAEIKGFTAPAVESPKHQTWRPGKHPAS